jgi:hypothetical protein
MPAGRLDITRRPIKALQIALDVLKLPSLARILRK